VNTGALRSSTRSPTPDAAGNAWLHVDGAFGMWAAVSVSLRHLVDGVDRADSWATDAHKWLNVPYDCGVAFTAHPDDRSAAFSTRAPYLVVGSETREALDWNPSILAGRAGSPSTPRSASSPKGDRGARRALLRARSALRRRDRGDGRKGANDVELNQVLFRFPMTRAPRRPRRRAAQRRDMDERDEVGRPSGDPLFRLELAGERRRRRPDARAYRAANGGHVAAR